MRPEELERELRKRGLEVLAVTGHRCNPEVLVVYLHGNAGQTAGGFALDVIVGVPGVRAVEESVSARTVLLVRLCLLEGEDGRG